MPGAVCGWTWCPVAPQTAAPLRPHCWFPPGPAADEASGGRRRGTGRHHHDGGHSRRIGRRRQQILGLRRLLLLLLLLGCLLREHGRGLSRGSDLQGVGSGRRRCRRKGGCRRSDGRATLCPRACFALSIEIIEQTLDNERHVGCRRLALIIERTRLGRTPARARREWNRARSRAFVGIACHVAVIVGISACASCRMAAVVVVVATVVGVGIGVGRAAKINGDAGACAHATLVGIGPHFGAIGPRR